MSPREVIQHLFEVDKALDVADSIATRGFFPNEPLLAIKEGSKLIVVEGNRRLAALKALNDPTVVEGPLQRKIRNLIGKLDDPNSVKSVPVTLAPSRRATDRQIAGRHVGTPVLQWEAESKANFILSKLSEGYSAEELKSSLGFSQTDVQSARQTKALLEMARSLDLPAAVRRKVESPRAKILSTLERVFRSSVGREFFRVEPDVDHGIVLKTSKEEFEKAYSRLVTDLVNGKNSRDLNNSDNIKEYLDSWGKSERPKAKRKSIAPEEIIKSTPSEAKKTPPKPASAPKRTQKIHTGVLPKSLKVVVGAPRLVTIRDELVRLKRDDFPNAGAVLLRVFTELTVTDYLKRTGEYAAIEKDVKARNITGPGGQPTMKHLSQAIISAAKKNLTKQEAAQVEKVFTVNRSARFNLSELHSFVHNSSDHPTGVDLLQFWNRAEPLFRLMLEEEVSK